METSTTKQMMMMMSCDHISIESNNTQHQIYTIFILYYKYRMNKSISSEGGGR